MLFSMRVRTLFLPQGGHSLNKMKLWNTAPPVVVVERFGFTGTTAVVVVVVLLLLSAGHSCAARLFSLEARTG